MVIGESHYLPTGSTIHETPDSGYSSVQSSLSEQEKGWVHTERIITESRAEGFRNKAHSIYRNIAWELNKLGLGYTDYRDSFEHTIYLNYFQRPAYEGKSLIPYPEDTTIANEVLEWIVEEEKPELICFTSALAGRSAYTTLKDMNIPYVVTPHPGCAWWNRTAKSYGNKRGRDLLVDFLKEQHWIS